MNDLADFVFKDSRFIKGGLINASKANEVQEETSSNASVLFVKRLFEVLRIVIDRHAELKPEIEALMDGVEV